MKFPDDTSLMKHIGLKKQCLEQHNSSHLDQTIVQQLPIMAGNKDWNVDSISFWSQEDDVTVLGQESIGYMNSYATPHHRNTSSNAYYMSSQTENDNQYSVSMPAGADDEEEEDDDDRSAHQFSVNHSSVSSDEVIGVEVNLILESSAKSDDSWVPNSSSADL
jgi:hypothetical protein